MTVPHILIVDDDPALLQALPEALRLRLGEVNVETYDSGSAALARIATTEFDAIISDIKMPEMDGLALLARIKELQPATPTLLITGHGDHDLAVRALRGGAFDFVQKPIEREYFIASLQRAVQMRRLSRQVAEQQEALARHAETLEQTVQERTRELVAANRAKDALIAERDRALAEAHHATKAQSAARQYVEGLAAQLKQQAVELTTIIEAIPDAVYVYDNSGVIIRTNASGEALAGMPHDRSIQTIEAYMQIDGSRHLNGMPMAPDDNPLNRTLSGETHTNVRYLLRHFDTGEDIQVRVSCAPLRDAEGAIIGAVAVAGDTTKLYQLERQKEEFLSIASHELKTPLTTIKAMTQMTRRALEREQRPIADNLARVERAIVRMEKLVNDLVDSSRIEVGKLALHMERCDLRDICRQVIGDFTVTTDRPITLISSAEALEFEADGDRIGQVIANLISNALKYSPDDLPIMVKAERDGAEVVVSVHDEGAGIPFEEQEQIFERFYRVPQMPIHSGSEVGLGLGLHICREIVTRHHGHIWVKSAAGEGTTFFVALPAAVPAGKAAVAPSRHRQQKA
ncbi:MAG TPA: response regulator [Ktedonobacterales bacterium]|nr:response regulator [Ktedonobacterales bacterium]